MNKLNDFIFQINKTILFLQSKQTSAQDTSI